MAVTFHIPGYLRQFTDGVTQVDVDGSVATVGEALAALWEIHPGVRDRVVDEQGVVRMHVNVFVGDEAIRLTGGLNTAVGDGAEISIVPAVSGGGK
jgi:molybdopterin converting factor small subunit